MTKNCKWCTHNPYSSHCDSDGNCDFKNLPFDKDAILERVKAERSIIQDAKEKIISTSSESIADEEVAQVLDSMKGIQIMVDVLMKDFGMSEKELKDIISLQKDSFIQRAKMASKLSALKKSRGRQR